MLGALIIVFREVIEAGLIVGIVMAATRGAPHAGRWVMLGIAGGLAGAALMAVFAEKIANAMAGIGQEMFNAGVLALAVVMLAWHNIWMASHSRELVAQMKQVGNAVTHGGQSMWALVLVVALAVAVGDWRDGGDIPAGRAASLSAAAGDAAVAGAASGCGG